jgi:hypothetical protein
MNAWVVPEIALELQPSKKLNKGRGSASRNIADSTVPAQSNSAAVSDRRCGGHSPHRKSILTHDAAHKTPVDNRRAHNQGGLPHRLLLGVLQAQLRQLRQPQSRQRRPQVGQFL